MTIKTKKCFKCGQVVYETGEMVTSKAGDQFAQKFNAPDGKVAHYTTCPKNPRNQQKQQQQQQQQQAQAQEQQPRLIIEDNKFNSTPTTAPTEETATTTNNNNVSNTDLRNDIQKIKETLGDMTNTIELIAIALNVKLPGREPRTLA